MIAAPDCRSSKGRLQGPDTGRKRVLGLQTGVYNTKINRTCILMFIP